MPLSGALLILASFSLVAVAVFLARRAGLQASSQASLQEVRRVSRKPGGSPGGSPGSQQAGS